MSIIIEYGLLHKRPISIIDSIVLIKKVGMQVNGEFFAEMEKKKKKNHLFKDLLVEIFLALCQ